MNILYIFGNGLDKAQGMRTSYPEFYDYLYNNTIACSPLMRQLKDEIKADVNLWSDMEEALGKFTANISSQQDFEDLYFDLSQLLQSYLQDQDSRFTPSSSDKRKFCHDLLHYDDYLGEIDKSRYNRFIDDFINYRRAMDIDNSTTRNIMTFNYTHSLEKLTEVRSDRKWSRELDIKQIIHVHGTLDDTIIFGVDNESQITNESFSKNDDIKDILVKNQSNLSMKFQRSINCEQLIEEANVIILFGVSLGKTDGRWWELIGEQLKKRADICVIQFIYSPVSESHNSRLLEGRIERAQKDKLTERMRLNDEEEYMAGIINERLFFVINSDAFKTSDSSFSKLYSFFK